MDIRSLILLTSAALGPCGATHGQCEIARITHAGSQAGDAFGAIVAVDGHTAVLGAPFDDGSAAAPSSTYSQPRQSTPERLQTAPSFLTMRVL